ncbi:MAG: chemotaxis response regulator protein-glutamate methylesterase [Neomegalonema sp.]|nr:chemotaxis response regulator protein-glutamate methylesterase [Neomegalonema sp.]
MSGRNIRALVVDDSLLMRTMLRSALESERDIEVVGAAKEPYEARQMIKDTNPDVVTLDVEMPGMTGLEFLEKIMTLRPMPVVMVSSLTSEGAEATLAALSAGAVGFVPKQIGGISQQEFGATVRQKVREAARAKVRPLMRPISAISAPVLRESRRTAGAQLIAVGSSTGGVQALGRFFQALPRGLPPIVVTQHMPPGYTERFAQRLAGQIGQDVSEARDGEVLRSGMIRIAPGSQHMEVVRVGTQLQTRLNDEGKVSGHKPSVDVLFRSVAKHVGAKALGVILTGMGSDGAAGMLSMRRAGAMCLGEAESSCVVYGMPKAAKRLGGVSEEHDLSKLPARVCELLSGVRVQ